MKFILMDVEGTTTSIEFVHKTLFPYSKEKMSWFLENFEDICAKEKTALEQELQKSLTPKGMSEQLIQWINQDKKHPQLKSIQGKIWQRGYESGEIKGHVYDDVAVNFERWAALGLKLGIYSSGSVLAQKLLFKYSSSGDLTSYLSAHFDTAVGAKQEVSSYQEIARQLDVLPQDILFLSDISKECHAALGAGYQSAQILRKNAPFDEDQTLQRFEDFHQILS